MLSRCIARGSLTRVFVLKPVSRSKSTAGAFKTPNNLVDYPPSSAYNAQQVAMDQQVAIAKEWKITDHGWKRRKLDSGRDRRQSNDWEMPDPLEAEVERLLLKPKREGSQPDQKASNPAEVVQSEDHGKKIENPPPKTKPTKSSDFYETELVIEELSSIGEGLARAPSQDHVYVIPFTLPGERVIARVRPNAQLSFGSSSNGDLVKVLDPSPMREGITPKCQYFGTCSGCQLQMMPYEGQLAEKRKTVESAFRFFSGLSSDQVPEVAKTGASPLQYGYRTKLTPHFDAPPMQSGKERWFTSAPEIGFNVKGRKGKVLDIESCPIGTEILQEGFKQERAKVARELSGYFSGATLLLRETTDRVPTDDKSSSSTTSTTDRDPLASLPDPSSKTLTVPQDAPAELHLTYPSLPFSDTKYCARDGRATITEHIGTYKFETRAGSFFQNNNAILPSFLRYVRSQALPPPINTTTKPNAPPSPLPPVKYLLDAYSGSGLFSLTLSPLFSSVLGIEIDGYSVQHARLNASSNNITNCGFIEADASALFADVPYPADQTVVVIDPPRKGCSKDFLGQLLEFGARRVVYVSCNVNSQARDVGVLVRGGFEVREGTGKGKGRRKGKGKGKAGVEVEGTGKAGVEVQQKGWRYEIESLIGWDFFPQTSHVEGVCILNRVEKGGKGEREVEKAI